MNQNEHDRSQLILKKCQGLRQLISESPPATRTHSDAQRVGHIVSLIENGETDQADRQLSAIFRDLQAACILNQESHDKYFLEE